MSVKFDQKVKCYHCGDDIIDLVAFDQESFCCYACKNVYEILKSNNLTNYYEYNEFAGTKISKEEDIDYGYLDSDDVLKKILVFKSKEQEHVYIKLPAIHCSSCIWLLENLKRLNDGIVVSEVNFSEKKLFMIYNPTKTKLSEIADLLIKIGYKPVFEELEAGKEKTGAKSADLYMRIAVAGFAFGNIMLMTFPDYIDSGFKNSEFFRFFPFLCLLLSIPVLFYSAAPYFKSAFYSLKELRINIDLPISMGIAALFLQSIVDIFFYSKFGYLDSFSAFVFFLLIGRIFQEKSYEHLNFEKEFKSFFPLSIQKKRGNLYETVLLEKLKKNDIIKVRNNEVLPADSICLSDHVLINYSFVSGESELQTLKKGDTVFAGGRLEGKSAEFSVIKEFSKSHLVKIWNNASDTLKEEKKNYADSLSLYFTILITCIAFSAFLINMDSGLDLAVNRFLAIIIVACPCAIALTTPFTLGTMSGILAKLNFYVKNSDVVEKLAKIQTLVFDKTGTLSDKSESEVYQTVYSDFDKEEFALILSESLHPLAQSILKILPEANGKILDFKENVGSGIEALTANGAYKIGSASFLGVENSGQSVYVMVNQKLVASYEIREKFRKNLDNVFRKLNEKYRLYLLSGDRRKEDSGVFNLIQNHENIYFEQKPNEKYDRIKELNLNSSTAMFGDGVNDSAALNESDVGIAVVDDFYQFSPSADIIVKADQLSKLDEILSFVKSSRSTIISSFIISILYNVIGIYFAYTGQLEPVICAIIMPLSSISVILFTVLKTKYHAFMKGLGK